MVWYNSSTREPYSQRHLSGLTLVEIIIVISMSLILLGACVMFFVMGFDLLDVGEIAVDLQQELCKAEVWITDELRQSGSLVITGVPTDGGLYNAITFQISNGVSNSRISWSGPIQYRIDSNQLQRIAGGNTMVIAEQLQELQFSRQAINPNIVEVAMRVAKQSKRTTMNDKVKFRVKLRN